MKALHVRLWGSDIGAVTIDPESGVAYFRYEPDFVHSGIQPAPLQMPLDARNYSFPALPRKTFLGLPGMLADALPDKFGNALLSDWVTRQGLLWEEVDAITRLAYVGQRGMGALEFAPAEGPAPSPSEELEVAALVQLASEVLRRRGRERGSLDGSREGLEQILRVGASAGGARAKALIAWNPETQEVRSGQVPAPEGFGYWLLKFDGVDENADKELADPQGFGALEYAYSLMAREAGVTMSDCRLLEEHGRRHFMTRRFDRTATGDKLHLQSLCALAHLDFNHAGAHSYEEAVLVIRRLGLGMGDVEQQFRRAAFNIAARNQDDHVKNIAFLMDREGRWSLSPAFDVTYSFNPSGPWTRQHQLRFNGKRDGFKAEDFRDFGRTVGMKRTRPGEILDEVLAAVARWPDFAAEVGVEPQLAELAGSHHRVDSLRR